MPKILPITIFVGDTVYIVKQYNYEHEDFEFQGAFTSEAKALKACHDPNFLIVPLKLNEELPLDRVGEIGYYPYEQKEVSASEALNETQVAPEDKPWRNTVYPSGPWKLRWRGSPTEEGYTILSPEGVMAYLGTGVSSEDANDLVWAHNVAVAKQVAS